MALHEIHWNPSARAMVLVRNHEMGPDAEGFDPDAWADPVSGGRGPLGWVRWWAHGHGHGRGPSIESELEAWLRSTMCRRIEFRRASRCLVCPSCGASASLPLGVTCADHQLREVWS